VGVTRFGGWSLGESTHLINAVAVLGACRPPAAVHRFVLDENGSMTLPIWVDHVGSRQTLYAVGRLALTAAAPSLAELPKIPSR
jgi:CRISPR-associated protein Cas5t